MALQIVKTSYNGSVDLARRTIRLPDPERPVVPAAEPRRRAEPGRLDAFRLVVAGLPMAVLSMASVPALAANLTLTDGNSAVTLDPSTGLTGWTVGGTQQLNVQQFYYRLGSSGGQSLLSTGATTNATQPLPSQANVTYSNPTAGFTATVVYKIQAGDLASDPAVLTEDLTLKNTTASPESLHFYKYADFNLNGQSSGQSVTITGAPRPNTADQFDSLMSVQSDTVGQAGGQPPNEVQASVGPALLASISGSSPVTLNNTTTAGPGDVNWAFQWDQTLGASGSPNNSDTFQASIPTTIQAVPEPATAGMMAVAGSLLLARRRRNPTAAASA